ncbi:MAG: ZIP family metal transporter [Planctomycetota bacterium]
MWDLVAIFGIAVLGGAAPLLARWSDRSLHVALALSTGLFLGAVFLHLLPEIAVPLESAAGADSHAALTGHDHDAHQGQMLPWLFVLLGALSVYLFEALVLRTHDHDDLHRHRAVSMAALAGLSVHALTAGVSYGMARDVPGAGKTLLVAMLAHKGFEAFSLTSVFQLASLARRQVLLWVLLFACVTPLGVGLGQFLATGAGHSTFTVLQAIAAGTFLFVCMGELLPEVFHHREDSLSKLGLLGIGIALMWFVHDLGL